MKRIVNKDVIGLTVVVACFHSLVILFGPMILSLAYVGFVRSLGLIFLFVGIPTMLFLQFKFKYVGIFLVVITWACYFIFMFNSDWDSFIKEWNISILSCLFFVSLSVGLNLYSEKLKMKELL